MKAWYFTRLITWRALAKCGVDEQRNAVLLGTGVASREALAKRGTLTFLDIAARRIVCSEEILDRVCVERVADCADLR